MQRSVLPVAAISVLLALTSCNSMSKEECAAADWRVIGETDGAAGYDPQNRFADHVKSCKRINVVPDQTVWYDGYRTGLTRYCTPLSGLNRGNSGESYRNVCPPETAGAFMSGYQVGQKAHSARSRLNSVRSSIDLAVSEINQLEERLRKAEDKDRRDIREQIRDKDSELRRLRREAADLQYELEAAERAVEYFRQGQAQPMPGTPRVGSSG